MLTRNPTLTISPEVRYRLATALIWVGVLAWAPFILLRTMGYRPSLLWFLPFHLLGVVGGSRLRAAARRELGVDPPRANRLRTAGHVLVFSGIAVWAPYFYLKLIAQVPVQVLRFLPFHLAGILGGITLLVVGTFVSRREG